MSQSDNNNKRIVKNTIYLYFRMLLLMFISFYSTRIVLKALGVDDYGVYNVVGGIVAMLSFMSSSLTLATNRFFSYALGKKDIQLLNKTYSTSVIIFLCFSILIVILAETVGIWYFYHYIKIPPGSETAAMWVYQLSIITAFIGFNTSPIMSIVISHEDMRMYAMISLLEGGLKLGIAFLLLIPFLGNLKSYAIMTFISALIIRLIWHIYTKKKYKQIKFTFKLDKIVFKDIFSFIGWQIVGSVSWLLRNQGVNLVLNFFFGPALNTARSLAIQVNSGITSLVGNFQMASNPQMVKYYASDDTDNLFQLLFRSSKLSFLLILIFALPIGLEVRPILLFWLGEIPNYTIIFIQLIIIATLVDSLSGTLQQTVLATGKIKQYTQIVTTIMLSDILIVYLAYKLGYPPQALFYAEILIYALAFIARLYVTHHLLPSFKIIEYLKHVTMREIAAFGVAIILIGIYGLIFPSIKVHFILELIIFFGITGISCYYAGLTKAERVWVRGLIISKIGRR